MRKSTVVLGLGNPLMADEGIGIYLLERLQEFAGEFSDVDFIDAGTGGLSVLHQMEGRRRAFFIDCAYMGEPPGAIRRFAPEEVRTAKMLAHQSLHEADLLRIIAMSRQLGRAPEEIVIFGIQPERVETGSGLSRTLIDRADEYIWLIRNELV